VSVSRTTVIHCDACDEVMSNADIGEKTAAEARKEARREGGHTGLRGGRDICEYCWREGHR
jgi:hypothetical protein